MTANHGAAHHHKGPDRVLKTPGRDLPRKALRTLVTTVAALPVLAMPALASDAIGPNHPDAELLRLGVELEAVIVEWHE